LKIPSHGTRVGTLPCKNIITSVTRSLLITLLSV